MTPERFARLQAALDRRQPDLTLLLDNVHKPHNVSAILRTCDAVGVYEVHAVWHGGPFRPHRRAAAGSAKWVDLHLHPSLADALEHLRGDGYRVLAAHPGPGAVDFRDADYTRPTALVLGAELKGVSREALSLADGAIVIPMLGLGESLNVSVAAATVLFEAQRQRQRAGLYERSRLDEQRYRRTLFEWAYPEVAKRCRRRGLPYPPLDEDGLMVASASSPEGRSP